MPSGVVQSSDESGLSRSSVAASFFQSARGFFGKSAMVNYVTQRGRFAIRLLCLPRLTGEVPPQGAEGKAADKELLIPDLKVSRSSVWLSPSGTSGHLPRMTGEAKNVIRWPGWCFAPRDRSGWPSA